MYVYVYIYIYIYTYTLRARELGHANTHPWKHVPLDFEKRENNSIYSMMDWTRLGSNVVKMLPRD